MARSLALRLDRLERLAAELLHQHVAYKFIPHSDDATLEDYTRLREEMLDEMVADGEITEGQRDRVSFARWQTKDEAAAMRRKTAEAKEWTPSEEALAGSPPVEEVRHAPDDDLLAEAERHRKLTRPIDELWPPPPGIV